MDSPKFKIYATISGEIRDKDGRIIRILPEVPANSFVLAFIDLLYRHFGQASTTTLETDGTSAPEGEGIKTLWSKADAATTTYGIVIGTGENAVAIDDNKLQTQVTANIAYGECTAVAPSTVGSTRQFDMLRTFTNNTGAPLSIKEVGLYALGGSGINIYCLDRSLYSVEIANAASATLRYRIAVEV